MASQYVSELDAQLHEVRFGVLSATTAASDGGAAASATLVTLEELALAVRMDERGVHVLSPPPAEGATTSFDSVNSLLLNMSKGFTAKFNEALAAALAAAVTERENNEERGGDDDDYASFKSYDSAQDDRPWH